MEIELMELVEKAKIVDVITAMFVGTDRRDWETVRNCFAPEVAFDMTSLAGGEPAELTPVQITSAWDTGLSGVDAIHHQAGNFAVSLKGTRATASCYGVAWHYRKTTSGRNTRVFVGTYDFQLELTAGRWTINAFRFNKKFIDGNPDLEKD